jgi:U4/U6 small nuclear ribonucleoprotein PRP4
MNLQSPQHHYTAGGAGAAGTSVQVLQLSAASEAQRLKHEAVLLDLEAKKIAATLVVPTLPDQVRAALRDLQCPVRLFGENLANVRDRLRLELARRQLIAQRGGEGGTSTFVGIVKTEDDRRADGKDEDDDEGVTKYTQASASLVQARQEISQFSLQRAAARLERERAMRGAAVAIKRKHSVMQNDRGSDGTKDPLLDPREALEKMDKECTKLYQRLDSMTLEGSQYGDSRTVSCICTQSVPRLDNHAAAIASPSSFPLIATGSWTGSIHLWDGSTPNLLKVGEKTLCHEDRIMGMSMMVLPPSTAAIEGRDDSGDTSNAAAAVVLCTASIDMTAKLWKVVPSAMEQIDDKCDEALNNADASPHWSIIELAHLKGHKARLCRTAFHPMKRHVATTSFDHSWRLWDVETTQEMLLLQDGHWKEVYGVGFHPDGSLCATTDFAGVVQVWDLRTGKSIRHFVGHAKRVLNAEFHPANGFQLATAGDDGTIKIWDLRQRKMSASIPAHSNLVTQLRFDSNGGSGGEYLASSSWSTRNWKMLNVLHGHEGKVAGVDIAGDAIVSCGFDKTLKLWS